MKYAIVPFVLIYSWLLLGCSQTLEVKTSATPLPTHAEVATHHVVKASPTMWYPTLTLQPSRTAEPGAPEICSPLEGYSYPDLEAAVVNPYLPPAPGSDRVHQGVDIAVVDEASGLAISGQQVHAVLSGEITMIIADRFPYGNAVMIGTPLGSMDELADNVQPVPTAWAAVTPDPALTCPEYEAPELAGERRAIYILYAHLEEVPSGKIGTKIRCGEEIGKIGMSGNALNPHVHIEARLGPEGATFESIAHYDSSATIDEMRAYCQWRVSGIFQNFDPMLLLHNLAAAP